MIAALRTVLFDIVFYLGCVPVVTLAFVLSLSGREGTLYGARLWARYHGWCARWLLGVRTQVEGVLPQGAVIVAMKHESMFETIELLRLWQKPAVVLKAELMRIPVWGRTARTHGVIPVEREAGPAALRRMLAAARAAVADDRPVLIFPEGTRVPHGVDAPLRPGVAGLYKSLKLPVVPVAIDSGKRWARGAFIKRAGIVRFVVGTAIPPGLPRDEFEARVRAGINAINDR